MIDVKKFITGFLILAVAVVFSGVIFSLINNGSQTNTPAPPGVALNENEVVSPVGADAFLPQEQTSEPSVVADASSEESSTFTDPSNLTDDLADSFLTQVSNVNPNGFAPDSQGDLALTAPDPNSIALDLANATATQNFQIPDWDIEAESQPINVTSTSNPASISQYANALYDNLSGHFNTQAQSILNADDANGLSASDITYIQSQTKNALGDTLALQVPTPLVGYQKALVKMLVYQKNYLQLLTDAQTDPVKASLISQSEDQGFSVAQQELLTESQEVQNELSSPQSSQNVPEDKLVALVNNLLGIQTAHAQWQVFDPATWSAITTQNFNQIANQIKKEVENTLLQILINTLVAIIQRKALGWLQGSGAPRFLTSWGTQLITTFENSAINSINSKMQCGVYPAYIQAEKIMLQLGVTGGNSQCGNQFRAALAASGGTLQGFYKNFSNGGFLVFGASQMPSGNVYGDIFFNAQVVGNTAKNTQQANLAKNAVSGGFKGDQFCDDGSDPNNGEHTVCENPDGPDYNLGNASGTNCGTGDTPVVYANQGTCDDGTEPQVTTPASITGFTLNSAVDATPKQIAAAHNIVGVLNAVLSSLMNNLMQAAIKLAGQGVNQFLNNGQQGGIVSLPTSGIQATSTLPAQQPLSCAPSTQVIYITPTTTPPATISAAGGTYNSSTGAYPNYIWTLPGFPTSTGQTFTQTFYSQGFYSVMLGDDAGDTPTTCTVNVQVSQ